MEQKEKRVIIPAIDVSHNDDDSGLIVKIDLAGAHKDTLDLEVGKIGFCVKADGEDFRYESCFKLAHEVKPEKAKAKFDSGLLTIQVPFEEMLRGHKVTIE